MMKSPVTWGPLAGLALLALWADLGAAAVITVLIVVIACLLRYWRVHHAELAAASLRELIAESNADQDLELQRIIHYLRDSGHRPYALCLQRFAVLKKAVETEIHREGHLSPFAREVESDVDGIAREVCLEITRLRGQEEELAEVLTSRDAQRLQRLDAARRDSQTAILQAYSALYQTHASITALKYYADRSKSALPATAGQPGQRLNEILTHLREEAEAIARTQDRVQRDMVPGVEQ